jgi:hypothetical protein
MTSIWAESVAHSLQQALDMLAAAVSDCPDHLWESSMWAVASPGPEHRFLGPDWKPITDPGERAALAQRWAERWSTPWGVAWHALEGFDYDLNGEFSAWMPPPPFAGHPHWRDLPSLPRAWSRPEILGYIDYCRERARESLAGMTEEMAARKLPPAHRYSGQPHARIITGILAHTTEHASQVRQFVPGPGRGASLRT